MNIPLPAPPVSARGGDAARDGYARQPACTLDQLLVNKPNSSRIGRIGRKRQGDVHQQHVVAAEARIDCDELNVASCEQHRTDQQHGRHRRLRCDEHVARARAPTAAARTFTEAALPSRVARAAKRPLQMAAVMTPNTRCERDGAPIDGDAVRARQRPRV
jgi:hypothetical protein